MDERHLADPDLRDIDELLHHDHYTVEEAAFLLGIDPNVLSQAAHRHELAAIFVEHHVIHLRRDDLIQWLRSR
jgi:hypothetical protein